MARKILFSLISEQTIPNVELIQEFKEDIDKFAFITTQQMKNQAQWIIEAANIKNVDTIEVNAFDIEDIEKKINSYDFGEAEIILNITGGTKLMSLIVNELFKNLGAKIFYVTGHKKTYIKVFPNRGKRSYTLLKKLTLREYLTAYGFSYKDSTPYKDYELSQNIFNFYIELNNDEKIHIFKPIRMRRGKRMEINNNKKISDFLNYINYPLENNKLNGKDTKYLSGDWFEEYVYYKIKEELNFEDDEIATGLNLKREGIPNEIDVIFIFNHKLYIIECKTSIIDKRTIKVIREGKEIKEEKEIKLLPEIIYKSDALRSKFGLFANTSIFTLEEIKEENGKPKSGYETHFERAGFSRINIISRRDILSNKSIKELLKIN